MSGSAELRDALAAELARVRSLDDDIEREAEARALSATLGSGAERLRRVRGRAFREWRRQSAQNSYRAAQVIFGLDSKTLRGLLR